MQSQSRPVGLPFSFHVLRQVHRVLLRLVVPPRLCGLLSIEATRSK